jgi:hypothetical protein
MSVFKKINPLNVLKKSAQPIMPTQLYAYKTRFAMLGPRGAGKTTVSGQVVLAAQTLSSDSPSFFCRVLEGTSSVLDAVSRLKQGHFPEKTVAYAKNAAESGLLLRDKTRWGEKRIQIPMVDIAGEDLDLIVEETRGRSATGISPVAYSLAQNLINYVKESDGYVLCVDASRALGIKGYNTPTDEVREDPDNYLHRLLSNIFTHKERSRGKAIKGIAVVITKWDTIAPYAGLWGMDVYESTGQGMKEFMDVCFPNTSMILKDYGYGFGSNIQIFPSYIEVERDSEGQTKKWADGSDKIVVKERRMPSCDLQSYINLMHFLLEFAT